MTENKTNKVQTKKRMIVAIVCIGGILLAANAAVNIWRCKAMDWYAYIRIALFHALAISIGRFVADMIKQLNSEGKEWVAIPAYALLLAFGTYIAIFGFDGRHIGYGVTYFSPAMMYTAIFVSSYVATNDFDMLWHKCAALFLIFSLPIVLTMIGSHSVSVGFTLCTVFIILLIKLFIIDEKHSRKLKVVLVLSAAIVALFVTCGGTKMVGTLITRFETFMTGGLNDPTGAGYVYHQLLNGIKKAQLAGPSSYEIAINSENSIPAYAFLAKQGNAYFIAAVILRWGWLFGALILVLNVALVVLLFKLSRLAGNDYARYFSYSVAVLFAVKIVFSLVSCFAVFVGEADMPMIGAFGGVTDVTLTASAVALCGNNTQE